MHSLEQLLVEWRKEMMAAPGVDSEILEELENHLRENMERLRLSGMTEIEAFLCGVAQLGPPSTIASEFKKLAEPTWLPIKVAIGAGIIEALVLLITLVPKVSKEVHLFWASHVFVLTLGYFAVFLTGFLGICFVWQSTFSDFSTSRMQSLSRASFMLSVVGASLTALGIVLGHAWLMAAGLGHFWSWVSHPNWRASWVVLVWTICFLSVHRLGGATARFVFLMSLLGNMVVGLAWLIPILLSHNGKEHVGYAIFLLTLIISSLASFLVGLLPEGCLRPKRAQVQSIS